MVIIEMMGGKKFEISKEEAQLFVGKSGLVPVKSLGGMINVSSISSILPKEIAERDDNRKRNRDGQWCIRKFGTWVLENNQDVKINLKYYPELEGGEIKKEIPSSFAKELSSKM